MSYGTLDRSILSSSLLDHGPAPTAFLSLIIAEKDKFGITLMNHRTLSKLFRMTPEEGEKAWRVLVAKDPESSNPEFEGRRLVPYCEGWENWSEEELLAWKGKWRVVSHEKFQREHSLERKRERDAEAQRRKRDRGKGEPKVCGMTGCERPGVEEIDGISICSFHSGQDEAVLKSLPEVGDA